MKLENLKPAKGATHNSKRLGRGQGSGKGGTSTRGTKGAQARAGYEHKIGFEGGQMPIQRRVPKFGFKNPTRIEYKAVNVAAIQALAEQLGRAEIGVEDIKALMDQVRVPPQVGKYSVYIIDEVHMLSTGAFRCLQDRDRWW